MMETDTGIVAAVAMLVRSWTAIAAIVATSSTLATEFRLTAIAVALESHALKSVPDVQLVSLELKLVPDAHLASLEPKSAPDVQLVSLALKSELGEIARIDRAMELQGDPTTVST